MGKKRKAPRPQAPSEPKEIDEADARLNLRSYKDVANSEDEYWDEEDRIDFDDDPSSKRLKRLRTEDELLEPSDEEILGDDTSDDDEKDDAPRATRKGDRGNKGNSRGKHQGGNDSDSEDAHDRNGGEEGEGGDLGWWGSSRQEYYDADDIEDENDAIEEEAESKRIQAKKLAKMQEDDFLLAFDQTEWANGPVANADAASAGADGEKAGDMGEDGMVTEVLKGIEITDDMEPEEKKTILDSRYPEFDYLADEFLELQGLLAMVQDEADGKPAQSAEVVKLWVLGAYLASLASYFAILTSPSRDGDGAKTTDLADMRDHEIMGELMRCRETWLRVKALKPFKVATISATDVMFTAEDGMAQLETKEARKPTKAGGEKKARNSEVRVKKAQPSKTAKQAEAVEQSLANLSSLLKKVKPKRTATPSQESSRKHLNGPAADGDGDVDDQRSDFGDEEVMDESTARDKAKRKKSLRFYTSQIAQKANKRADAASGRAGGDADIPYRERLRDRQARLNAQAERRGRKGAREDDGGNDLGDDGNASSGGDDDGGGDGDDDHEYYDMVAHAAKKKTADKKAFYETLLAAGKGGRVVEEETVGDDGKRGLTWTIQKNKGLAPRRRKENRNPRVKKRMRFEEKQKKLKTMRAVYKGPQMGSYKGELSGIKTHLVKSIKL